MDAPDREIERAADRPQHHDEGRGREERRDHAGDEIDRRFGRDPHVVGDAVFRVLVVAAHQVELIVAPGREPAINQVVGEPLAPAPLNGHAGVDLRHVEGHARRQDCEVEPREEQDRVAVLVLQRIEDGAVPPVHPIGGRDVEEDDEEQRAREGPGDAALSRRPEAARGLPEPPQQIIAPELLGVLAGFLERLHLIVEILGFCGLGGRRGLRRLLGVLRVFGRRGAGRRGSLSLLNVLRGLAHRSPDQHATIGETNG